MRHAPWSKQRTRLLFSINNLNRSQLAICSEETKNYTVTTNLFCDSANTARSPGALFLFCFSVWLSSTLRCWNNMKAAHNSKTQKLLTGATCLSHLIHYQPAIIHMEASARLHHPYLRSTKTTVLTRRDYGNSGVLRFPQSRNWPTKSESIINGLKFCFSGERGRFLSGENISGESIICDKQITNGDTNEVATW